MIDALWIATSGVAYWLSEMAPSDSLNIDFVIDTHPCGDQPYVAHLSFPGLDQPAQRDGSTATSEGVTPSE